MESLRLLILDLDGTLVDSSDAIVDGVLEQAASEGLDVPSREWAKSRIGFPPEETWRLIGAPDPQAAVRRFRERTIPTLSARSRVLDGAREALAEFTARGLALAVATTRVRCSAVDTLTATGLLSHFAVVAGIDQVAAPKPAPDIIRHVLSATQSSPSHALMVGDTTADIEAAHAAGLPCWSVLGGHGTEDALREAGSDRILTGIRELPRALWGNPHDVQHR